MKVRTACHGVLGLDEEDTSVVVHVPEVEVGDPEIVLYDAAGRAMTRTIGYLGGLHVSRTLQTPLTIR